MTSLLIYGRFSTKSEIEEKISIDDSVSYSGFFSHKFSSVFIIASDLTTTSLRGVSGESCFMACNYR